MKSRISFWLLTSIFFVSQFASHSSSAAEKPKDSGTKGIQVTIKAGLQIEPLSGRLYAVFGNTNSPEPRQMLGKTGPEAPVAFAVDMKAFGPNDTGIIGERSFGYPITNISQIPAGDYFVQCVFDSNPDLRAAGSPGNLYSEQRKIHWPSSKSGELQFQLSKQIDPEQLPKETDQVKYVKIKSELLSRFHGRPIYLRAGVLLPKDFEKEKDRHYPLWIQIGGFNTRYTNVRRQMSPLSQFRKTWLSEEAPRMILLQLDGDGPNGDPYQINSEVNGPYGDAVVKELIPFVEQKFRGIGLPRARVLSGTSTGGWVCLALQVFYPDSFNGAWSSCPDPVDFRAFELVNIYQDKNAYVNDHGKDNASERNLSGEVVLTMRQEVGAENLLGRGNSYTLSGQQWGAWNAVYGTRAADGTPVPLWDPRTGQIDHKAAEIWRRYDLREYLSRNWPELSSRLRGKIHITSGEADQYYLNNAAHLLDEFLSKVNPPAEASITFGPGKGHGWSNLTMLEMMREMQARTGPATP